MKILNKKLIIIKPTLNDKLKIINKFLVINKTKIKNQKIKSKN